MQKLVKLRCDLADIDDLGVEFTLCRLCANVSKVTHLLQAQDIALSLVLLDEFDRASSSFVDRILGGELPKHATDQAALGLSH